MPTTTLIQQGTTVTWLNTAGDETITLTSLADNAARQGDVHDFGVDFPPLVRIELETAVNVAPTANEPINVHWASSLDGTDFDGELGASDAAVSDVNSLNRLHYVGTLAVDDDTATIRGSWVFALPARYGLPVIENQSGQALSSTAGNHHVKVTPLTPEFQN